MNKRGPSPWTAENDGRSPSKSFGPPVELLREEEPGAHGVKALEKYRFRPMYAPRHAGAGCANMGHPSRTMGRGWEMKIRQLPPPIFPTKVSCLRIGSSASEVRW